MLKLCRLILLPLAATLVIETALGMLIERKKEALMPLIAVNLLTNPALNCLLQLIFNITGSYAAYYAAVAAGEAAVVIAEGLVLAKHIPESRKKGLLVSLLLNAVSFGTGVILSGI